MDTSLEYLSEVTTDDRTSLSHLLYTHEPRLYAFAAAFSASRTLCCSRTERKPYTDLFVVHEDLTLIQAESKAEIDVEHVGQC